MNNDQGVNLFRRPLSPSPVIFRGPTEAAANMKTIALLGGMTYGATSIYYNIINKQIQKKLGGAHSANLLLQSFDHAEMQTLFTGAQWDAVTAKFSKAAANLKAAGADGVMICCNVGHKVADEVERQSGLPLLHIADPTGQKIKDRGIRKVGLIGTQPVMEHTFVSTSPPSNLKATHQMWRSENVCTWGVNRQTEGPKLPEIPEAYPYTLFTDMS